MQKLIRWGDTEKTQRSKAVDPLKLLTRFLGRGAAAGCTLLFIALLPTVAAAQSVCDRTPAVQAAILERLEGPDRCNDVSATHLSTITSLLLGSKNITSLQAGDFAGLSALEQLFLGDNPLLVTLPPNIFAGLAALEVLSLHENNLQPLPADIFADLGALIQLSLNHNDLEPLPEGIFDGLAALEYLDLISNGLRILPETIFNDLKALRTLLLYENGLAMLPEDIFDGLTALQRLELSQNRLPALPADIFDGLAALEVLRVDQNLLQALPADIFDGLAALQNLDLSQNNLQTLPVNIFNDLGDTLLTLDLHVNGFQTLPASIFDNLKTLQSLHLSSNKLAMLPAGFFDNLDALKLLSLSGAENTFETLPTGLFTPILDTLIDLVTASSPRFPLPAADMTAQLGIAGDANRIVDKGDRHTVRIDLDPVLTPFAVALPYTVSLDGGAGAEDFRSSAEDASCSTPEDGVFTFAAEQSSVALTFCTVADVDDDNNESLTLTLNDAFPIDANGNAAHEDVVPRLVSLVADPAHNSLLLTLADVLSFTTTAVAEQSYYTNAAIPPLTLPATRGGAGDPQLYNRTLAVRTPGAPAFIGLGVAPATGILQGQPIHTGSFVLRYTVTDAAGSAVSLDFTVAVADPVQRRFIEPDKIFVSNRQIVSRSLVPVLGGFPELRYSLTPDVTQLGLSFGIRPGTPRDIPRWLSGTPISVPSPRTLEMTYTVRDSYTSSLAQTFTITVRHALRFEGSIPDQTFTAEQDIGNLSLPALPAATGGFGALRYSLPLPASLAGLNFDAHAEQRILSGAPELGALPVDLTYTVRDSLTPPSHVSLTFQIRVFAAPAFDEGQRDFIVFKDVPFDLTISGTTGGRPPLQFIFWRDTFGSDRSLEYMRYEYNGLDGIHSLIGTFPDLISTPRRYEHLLSDSNGVSRVANYSFRVVEPHSFGSQSIPDQSWIQEHSIHPELTLPQLTQSGADSDLRYYMSDFDGIGGLQVRQVGEEFILGGAAGGIVEAPLGDHYRLVWSVEEQNSGLQLSLTFKVTVQPGPLVFSPDTLGEQIFVTNIVNTLTLPTVLGGTGTRSYRMNGEAVLTFNGLTFDDNANPPTLSGTPITAAFPVPLTFSVTDEVGVNARLTFSARVNGICERTLQVRQTILSFMLGLGIFNCENVSIEALANVRNLELGRQGIGTLQRGDFTSLSELTFLLLSANGLAVLPDGVFDGLGALQTLGLGQNQLTSLPTGIFDDLGALRALDMFSNSLQALPENVFDQLAALTQLFLQNNALGTLRTDIFQNLVALEELHLQNNQLTALPATLFAQLGALTVLNLGDNQLAALPENIFDPMVKLDSLDLRNNRLPSLPAGIFDSLNALQTLHLGGAENTLATLPTGLFLAVRDTLTALGVTDSPRFPLPGQLRVVGEAMRNVNRGQNPVVAIGVDPLLRPFAVALSYSGGGDTDRDDFISPSVNQNCADPESGIAVIAAGESSTELTFCLVADARGASNERFTMTLAAAPFPADNAGATFHADVAPNLASLSTDAMHNSVTLLLHDALTFSSRVRDKNYFSDVPIPILTLPVAGGGTGAYTYALSGAPADLSFDAERRTLSGTPSVFALGDHPLTYSVTDAASTPDRSSLTFIATVSPGSLVFTPATLDEQIFLTNIDNPALSLPVANGGTGAKSYALTGSFNGLIFDATDPSTLSGMPITAAFPTPLTFTATDAAGVSASLTFNVRVNGICERTEAVWLEILAALNFSASNCDVVTAENLEQVDTLTLTNESIAALQIGDFTSLSTLAVLLLDSNQIAQLHVDIFGGLGALTRLNLADNSLTSLPADIFADLDALQELRINGNGLTAPNEDLFDGLGVLTQLSLGGNALTSLPADIFEGLGALQDLFLDDNALGALDKDLFDGLGTLNWLQLHGNNLTTLPADIFDDLGALTQLELHDNRLTTLPASVFDRLNALTSLSLGGAQNTLPLADLPTGLFIPLFDTLSFLGVADSPRFPLPAPSMTAQLRIAGDASHTVNEGERHTLSIELQPPLPPFAVALSYTVSLGGGASANDFRAAAEDPNCADPENGALTVGAGQSSVALTFCIATDNSIDTGEELTFTIGATPAPATEAGAPAPATFPTANLVTLGRAAAQHELVLSLINPLTFTPATVDEHSFTAGQPDIMLTLPTAHGGVGNLSFALAGIPDGMRFDGDSRVLGGAPDATASLGEYDPVYTVSDANGTTHTLTFGIRVVAAPSFVSDITNMRYTASQPDITPLTLPEVDGGFGELSFQLLPESGLPEGLRYAGDSRMLSGAPDATATLGEYALTYVATDENGASASLTFGITVFAAPSFAPGTEIGDQEWTVRSPIPAPEYLQLPNGVNGTPPLGYTLNQAALPAGLSFQETTRRIVGIPSTVTTQPAEMRWTVSDANLVSAVNAFTISIVGADASRSEIAVAGSPAVADGAALVTITATVRDARDNPVGGETVSFAATNNADFNANSCTSDTAGQCSITVTSLVAAAYSTVVSIGAAAIDTAEYRFVAGGVDEALSSVAVSGSPATADGAAAVTITATVLDTNSNPINGATVRFADTSAVTLSAQACITDSSGQCLITATSTVVDTYSTAVSVATVDIGAAAYAFVADAVDPLNSSVVVGGSPATADGAAAVTFTATVRDTNNNPINAAIVRFADTGSVDFSPSAGTCSTNAQGQCVITATSTVADSYSTAVRVGAVEIDTVAYAFVAGVVAPLNSNVVVTGSPATADGAATVTITATVQDANNNPISAASVRFADTAAITLSAQTCSTDSNGQCAITATSTVADTYSTAVRVGAVLIDTAEYIFVADVVVAGNSDVVVSGSPATADGTATVTITATVRDIHNNPVSGQTVRFADTGSVIFSTNTCATGANGQCAITATSIVANTYSTAVSVGALGFDTAEYAFVADVVSAPNSTVVVTGSPATADGVATVSITATVQDANNNPLNGATVRFADTENALFSTDTCSTNSGGQCAITATSTVAATYSTAVNANAVLIGSAAYIFVAGNADAGRSTAEVGGSPALADGAAAVTFTATVRDAADNLVAGETVSFAVPTGVSLIATSCDTASNGQCLVTATSTRAGDYTVTVRIPTGEIDTLDYSFHAGDADTDNSSLAVAGSPAPANGVAAITFTATVRDPNSNPVSGETVSFATDTNVLLNTGTCATDSSGQCSVTATSTRADDYSVTASIPAGEIDSASFRFGADTADAGNSEATVGGSPATANGVAEVTFTATVRDINSNLVVGESVSFAAPAGVRLDPATCSTDAQGACSVSATSTVANDYLSAVSISNGTIDVLTYRFQAGNPDPIRSRLAVGGSPATANGAAAITFSATVLDANDNPIEGATLSFSGTTAVSFNTDTCATNSAGQCSITATSIVAGTYSTTASVGATEIDTAEYIFVADVAVAGNSEIEVTGSPAIANSTAAVTITATVRDANDNPVRGETVSFAATSNTNFSANSCATDADGQCFVTVTSVVAAAYTTVVNLGATEIDTAAYSFIAGEVSSDRSGVVVTGSPATADGVAEVSFTATVLDAHNNPINAATVSFADTAAVSFDTETCNTDSAGQCALTATSTVADAYSTVVSVGAVSIDTAEYSFIADDVEEGRSSVAVTGSPAVANGVAKVTFTATVLDTNNNPINATTVRFADTAAVTLNATTCNTDGNGQCAITATSIVAGTYSTAASVGALSIDTAEYVFVAGVGVAGNSEIAVSGSPAIADGSAAVTITATVRDANNNPAAGETVSFAATSNADFNANSCDTGDNGQCSIMVTSVVAAAYISSVSVRATEIDIAEYSFIVGDVDGSLSGVVVAGSPATADGVTAVTFTATVLDPNSNPISAATVSFVDTAAVNLLPRTCSTGADGQCSIIATSTVAGTYSTEVRAGTVRIDTAAYVFAAGVVSAPNSNVVVGGSPATADGATAVSFTATVQDANNNPINEATVRFADTGSVDFSSGGSTCDTNASGQCVVTATSIVAGTYTTTASVGGTEIDTAEYIFVADTGVAGSSEIMVRGSPATANGSAAVSITATVRDTNNNPAAGETVSFAATNNADFNANSCTSDAAGQCFVTVTSLIAAGYSTAVSVGGAVIDTAAYSFVAGDVGSGPSEVVVGGSPAIADGSAAVTFTATVLDSNSNPIDAATLRFVDTMAVRFSVATCATNSAGQCSITATSIVAGTYSTTVRVDTVAIDTAEYIFVADAGVAGNSEIMVRGSPAIANGTAAVTITATVRDTNNNPAPGETVSFAATNNASFNANSCTSDAAGQCFVTVTSVVAAAYTTAVSLGATAIGTASYSFVAGEVGSGPSEVVVGGSPATADGVAAVTFTATVLDANSNPISGQAVGFADTGSVDFNSGSSTCSTDSNGQCAITATSTVAGSYSTPASVGTIEIGAAVYTFVADAPVALNSSVAVSGSPAAADGAAAVTFTTTVQDTNNNPVSGQTVRFADTVAIVFNSETCATDTSGQCVITATSTVANTYTTMVSVDGAVIDTAEYIFVADTGVAGNSEIAVTGSPATANGSAAVTITATVRDTNNNPTPGETVSFAATSNTNFNANGCISNASGQCFVTVTSTVAAAYTTVVSIGATAIGTASYSFVAGNVDDGRSGVVVSGSPATADGVAAVTFTATVLDANSNPISGQTVLFADTGSVDFSTGTCDTDSSGQCAITATSTVADSYSSVVRVGALNIGTAEYRFVSGNADAGRSTAAVGGSPALADGVAAVTFSATVRDAQDNPVAGETVSFIVPAGVSLGATSCDTASDGQCSVRATSTRAGDYTVTVRITAAEIDTLDYSFHAGDADTDSSSLAVAGSPAPADGATAVTFTATVRDRNNNPVLGETVSFTVPADVSLIATSCDTDGSGQCSVRATSTRANDYTVTARIPTGAIATARFRFGADTADTGNSEAIVGGSPATANGRAEITFSATVRDLNNNFVVGESVSFAAPTGVSLDSATCSTDTQGACSVSATSVVANDYLSAVSISNGTIDVLTYRFQAGPVGPTRSRVAVGGSPATADGVAAVTFTATVLDANNNPIRGATARFADTGNVLFSTGTCSTDSSGQCAITATSATAGAYSSAVNVGATEIGVAEYRFVAGDISEDRASVAVTGSPAVADGTAAVTFTATVVDSNDNPIVGTSVRFADTENVLLSAAACETDSNGQCVISATSIVAGTYSSTLSIGAITIDTAEYVFVAGVGVGGDSEIAVSGSPAIADGSAAVTITATVRDANNNLVGGETVLFAATNNANFSAPSCATNAAGQCFVTVSSVVAAAYTTAVSIGGAEIDRAEYRFVASNVSRDRSSVAVGGSPATADGVAAVTFTATVLDANNNPISGATVRAADTENILFRAATCSTAANGQCAIDATSIVAGLYSTTISADSIAIDSAAYSFIAGDVDGDRSGVAVGGSPATADGVAAVTFTATVVDANNNPINGQSVRFDDTENVLLSAATCSTVANGQCAITATSTRAGIYSTIARIDAAEIGTAEYRFVAGDVDGGLSGIVVTGSPATADGVAAVTFTATVRDANDNPISGTTVGFANTENVRLGAGTCDTNTEGQCSITATSTVAGSYSTEAHIAATSIGFARYIFGAGAADATNSTVVVTGSPAIANGVTAITFTATVRDANDNLVNGEVISFADTDQVLFSAATCTTAADGQCVITATSTRAGTYSTVARIAAGNIATLSYSFHADVASVANSVLVVGGSPATADGVSAITFSATVRDANDNPVNGEVVSFADTDQVLFGAATCATAADGRCAITATSTRAGTYSTVASIGAGSIDTARYSFRAGAANPLNSEVALGGHPGKADGVAEISFTATVRDSYDNVVSGETVRFDATDEVRFSAANCSTDTAGQCTIIATSATVGLYHTAVHIEAGQIDRVRYAFILTLELSFDPTTVPDQTYTALHPIPALRLPAASGGSGSLSYSLRLADTATLPAGLSFDAASRTLSGAPAGAGDHMLHYTATDLGTDVTENLQFRVLVAAALTLRIADQYYEQDLPITPLSLPPASGGVSPIVYTLLPQVMPETLEGLLYDDQLRVLSGTPVNEGITELTYTARDRNGATAQQHFRIQISGVTERLDRRNRLLLPELAHIISDRLMRVVGQRIRNAHQDAQQRTLNLNGQSTLAGVVGASGQQLAEDSFKAQDWLDNSDFVLPLGSARQEDATAEGLTHRPVVTLWGMGDHNKVASKRPHDTLLDWDGSLRGAYLGVDALLGDRLLAGLMVSRNYSDLEYRATNSSGGHKLTLRSIQPYASYTLHEKQLQLWATASHGEGEVEISDAPQAAQLKNDIEMRLLGVGANGLLAEGDITQLLLKGDALHTRMEVRNDEEENPRLEDWDFDVSRVRIALEVNQSHALRSGAQLEPSLELGLRHEQSDEDSDSALELGAALRYTLPATGLSLSGNMHALFLHNKPRIWGIHGVLQLTPHKDGSGLSLSLGSGYGADAEASVREIWQSNLPQPPDNQPNKHPNLELRLGYGLTPPGKHKRILLTPYTELLHGDDNTKHRLGLDWQLGSTTQIKLQWDTDRDSQLQLRSSW